MNTLRYIPLLLLLLTSFPPLKAQQADDHGDTLTTATVIGVQSKTAGKLDSVEDVDMFRLDVYQFGFIDAQTKSNLNINGRLLDSERSQLEWDLFSGDGRNFRFDRGISPGTFYIEVEGSWRNDVGDYELIVDFRSIEERRVPATNLGDFNGDEYDDILLRNADGRWYYYPMQGTSYITEERGFVPLTRDLNYGLAGIGDFDGDGKDDVLLRHLDGRSIFYFMDGRYPEQIVQHPEKMPTDTAYQVVGIGKFNRYRDTEDVVIRHRVSGEWNLAVMSSFRRGGPSYLGSLGYGDISEDITRRFEGLGDFDGNGISDLLLRDADGRWYFYTIDTIGFVLEEGFLKIDEDQEYSLAGIADFNADGKDDILLRHSNGTWLLYTMDGSEPIEEESGSSNLNRSTDFELAGIGDLDGDGNADVLLRHVDGSWVYHPMKGRLTSHTRGISLNIASAQRWLMPVRVHRATVLGELLISQGQILDGDTGDPADPQKSNDQVNSAQSMPIPASIAGYLMEEIDEVDIYRVRLPTRAARTRVSLVIADPAVADYDLHLANDNGTVISEALGISEFEVIETTRSGWHQVAVSVSEGTSNYILVISSQLIEEGETQSNYTVNSDGAFVPNELVVTPHRPRTTLQSETRSGELVFRHSHWTGEGSSILLARDPNISNVVNLSHPKLADFTYQDSRLKERSALLYARKELIRAGTFRAVEPNYIYSLNREPNDRLFDYQWHYEAINLPVSWDYTIGDDDIVVAVIDTGILPNHPDLSSRILREQDKVAGYDFIRDVRSANDGDGMDSDPTDPGDAETPGGRNSFHGTHVAGTIGMATNNGVGGAGVTWNGKIMPIRVLGRGGGTDVDIAEGIRYAAGLRNASGTLPVRRANIINMSLGSSNPYCLPTGGPSRVMRNALEDAMDKGVVIVKSAGNDDCSFTSPDNKVAGVISVGASDFRDRRSYYSNYGSDLDVMAPGGDTTKDRNNDGYADGVLSTHANLRGSTLEYSYAYAEGTSMAAPHVAGVVSLMMAINRELTPTDINQLLEGSHGDPAAGPITVDLGSTGKDPEFGNGLINALRAVQVARYIGAGDFEPVEPVISISPSHLSFGLVDETLRTRIENIGGGELEVTSVEADVEWLSVRYDDPVVIVSADRFGLEEGTHLGKILVSSNGGVANVTVSIQVQTETQDADVGTVYVLLLDPQNFQNRGWGTSNARLGYSFQLPIVDGGEYLVIAGTDRDGDGSICDPGEACGRWPLLDDPGVLEVNGDSRIEFSVSIDLFARVSSQGLSSSFVPEEGFIIDRTVDGETPK